MFRRRGNLDENFNNNQNYERSYGKLRRKQKNYDLNNLPSDNYFSNNVEYNNYYKNDFSNYSKRKSNNLNNDNYSPESNNRDIHTSYKYKKDNTNYYDDNNIYNERNNLKRKPIMRPSKSALPIKNKCNHNNYNDEINSKKNEYLLCQNCINARLIEAKRRKNELLKKSSISNVFEDKYKNYSQNLIREKVRQREKNIKEIFNNLEKLNELSDKDKLIRQNENSINPLYGDNHNYLYEKFRTNYERKQKLIKDNFNKFQNFERPEITNYYNNYVNNPKYKSIDYGEYKPKIYDINNYKKDLDDQINYRNNKMKREREEDKMRENEVYNMNLRNMEDENKQKELKKKKMKEELIKGNLELINAKKQKREKLNEEDLKYRDYYNKESIEYKNDLLREKNIQKKINQQFLMDNQRNLSRIKRKKEEQMKKEENYRYNDYSYEPPKEITAECYGCHKIYPKKLLTPNAYFYEDIKK